jgi:cytochrome c oxidase subunit III
MSTAQDAHHDDHGHDHHGSPFVQHHYDDAQHQFDSGKFGIWLFLAQEVLFFSALFVAYILYRIHHGEIYAYAHKWLDVKMGAINTGVLIFSSLTAAWAVRCAQLNQKRGLIACITLTIACACGFLVIKYFEYTHKYHEGILFGRHFDPCISSNGNPLMTKGNECPGSKSSVSWTGDKITGKPQAGCIEQSTIDQDPRREGLQAQCTVHEVKVKLDAKGHATEQEVSRKPITEMCAEGGGHGHGKQKFPCWKPSYQPAVCPDLTDAVGRGAGKPSRPQVGIVVVYGDHEVRKHDVVIKPECTKAPAVPAAADPFAADAATHGELGKGSMRDKPRTLSKHEEHERYYSGPPPEHTNMFFTIYFAMTGLHGIHVLVGVFVFVWLLIRATKGHFTSDYFGPVDYAALYWHIVDLIWIFLFPLLYLIV